MAKNIVAARLARRCEVQLAYAIGVAEPVSVMVDTFGTVHGARARAFEQAVRDVFDLTPRGIIDALELRKPIYQRTAAVRPLRPRGRRPRSAVARRITYFTWERTDRVDASAHLAARTTLAHVSCPARLTFTWTH